MDQLIDFMLLDNGAPADAPAVFDERSAGWRTYGQLRDKVRALAALLGEPRKGLMCLPFGNELGSLSIYLAGIAARQAVAVIDAETSGRALLNFLESYAPDWCFLPLERASEMRSTTFYESIATPEQHGRLWRRRGTPCPTADIYPNLQLLLPTSGSTGSPKFARLSARNVISNTIDIIRTLGITNVDRAITSLPSHYVYGLSVLHSHLRAGASVVLTGRTIARPEFWRLVRDHRCTSFSGVPFSYRILRQLDFSRLDGGSLTKMNQAGGKLNSAEVRYFYDVMESRGGQFAVMYGQTEASPRMTTLLHKDIPRKSESVGLPMPSGRIWIRPTDEGRAVESDGVREIGEIFYAGPNVMMGYAESRSQLANGDEMDGVLGTGDLGYIDEDGFLHVCGRLKRIAKILGRRVNLDDVEAVASHYGDCAAMEAQDHIALFVASRSHPEQIEEHVLRCIGVHPNCLRVVTVRSLPLGSSGKIDYQTLRSLL